jgi:hypothetical protein
MKPGTFKPMLKAQPSLLEGDDRKPGLLMSLIAYEVVFFFAVIGLGSVIGVVLKDMLPAKLARDAAGWVFLGSVLLYVLLCVFFFRRAARLRAELGLGFGQGLRYAFEEVRCMCCSLPLIGPLITPDSHLMRDDDDDAEDDRAPKQ